MILENRCTRIVFKGGFIIFQAEQNNELKNLKPKFKRLPHVFFFVWCVLHGSPVVARCAVFFFRFEGQGFGAFNGREAERSKWVGRPSFETLLEVLR